MGHSGVNSLTRCNLFCHPRGSVSVLCSHTEYLGELSTLHYSVLLLRTLSFRSEWYLYI